MSNPYADAVQKNADANGDLTLAFNAAPTARWLVASLALTGASPAAIASVFAGSRLIGFVQGLTQATASGIRCRPGEPVTLQVSGMQPGDQLQVVLDGDLFDLSEQIPAPQFQSVSAVDTALESSQYASGVLAAGNATVTIVTPSATQSVRVLSAFVDVTGDCAVVGGGGVHVGIRLWDITANNQLFQLRRIFAPNAVPAGVIGSFPGPFLPFGSGGDTTLPMGHAAGIQVGTILTNGDVMAVLGFTLV